VQKCFAKNVQIIQSVWSNEQGSLPKIPSKMCRLGELNELK